MRHVFGHHHSDVVVVHFPDQIVPHLVLVEGFGEDTLDEAHLFALIRGLVFLVCFHLDFVEFLQVLQTSEKSKAREFLIDYQLDNKLYFAV